MIFGLTLLFLPEGYSMLITWFEPVFGLNLTVILTGFYALIGPYDDLLHISILIGAALVGGLIAGSAKGGIAVAISTLFFGFILMVGFGVLSFFTVMTNPTAQAQLMSLITSPPLGVDIIKILSAPVIGGLVDSIITFVLSGMGGGFDISTLIGTFIQPLLMALVVNVVLAIVFGAIGGKIGGYILPKKEKAAKSEEKKPEKAPSALEPMFKPDEGVAV
ncbi:MAG: hypothetical protein QW327_00965 [Candidatus Odinarchaeota archaeon]